MAKSKDAQKNEYTPALYDEDMLGKWFQWREKRPVKIPKKKLREVNFLQNIHNKTKRDYISRVLDDKPNCIRTASKFDKDYWDGDRKFGYGGYHNDGRWEKIAQELVEFYNLQMYEVIDCIERYPNKEYRKFMKYNRAFDIGCGKGYLMEELGKLGVPTSGCDISAYAINDIRARHEAFRTSADQCIVKDQLIGDATYLPLDGGYKYDFIYSINVFHNLGYADLKDAIKEMNRATKPNGKQYICVESYRTEEEKCNLLNWQLTCKSFYSTEDWHDILQDFGYAGDVEFITFA